MTSNKILKGFSWAAVDRITTQLSLFVVGIIIARLVSPSDYGILGLLLVFVNIAQVFVDSGLGSALIFFNNLEEKDIRTTFTFNIFVSSIIIVILYVAAPLFDRFFNNDTFHIYLRVISLQILINSLIVVPISMLKIRLDFRSIAIANTVAATFSGALGIIIAYMGAGIWALIAQVIARSTIVLIITFCACRYIPRIGLDVSALTKLFGYSINIFGASCITRLIEEGTSFVVGKYFSPHNLGLYTKANQFSLLPSSSIGSIIITVLFPSLARVKDDSILFDKLYTNVLKILSLLSVPFFVLMAVLAEPLVRVVLTDKWIEVVPYLQILCVGKILFPLSNISEQAINAKGYSRLYFQQQVVKMFAKLLLIIPAVFVGIEAVVIADALSYFAAFFITQYFGAKCGMPTVGAQIRLIYPYVVASLIAGIVVFSSLDMYFENGLLKITIYGLLYVIIYGSVLFIQDPSIYRFACSVLKK